MNIFEKKNPCLQGNNGVLQAAAFFASQGINVLMPLSGAPRYDLIIDNKGLRRIQVFTTGYKLKTGVHQVALTMNPADSDYLFILCSDGSKYLIPTEAVTSHTTLDLGAKYATYRIPEESL
jgi:hypothetical protein